MKKLLTYSLVITTIVWSVGLIAMPLGVAAVSSGSLIKKADSPAVYYLGADGKRYAFPRSEIYMTWYSNYSGVEVVSDEVFNSYAYGGSVFPKPGVKLVQFVDGETPWHVLDPKVYAVAGDGVLRHITTAEAAVSIFGANWETMIIPIIELLASEYTFGADIVSASDFDKAAETAESSTINENQNLGGVVSGGTSLTVSLAADTPASGIVVANAGRVPYTKVNLTASADGDITIDSWVVLRAGLAQDAAFSSVDILDGATMLPINETGKTFNSTHKANFTEDFVIPAGTTRSIYLAGNMGATGSYAGETPALALESVVLKSGGAVIGSLPITGNYQTVNGTITIGTATVSRGAYTNATDTTLEVGKTAYTFFSFKIENGSAEKVSFSNIKVYQKGSASLSTDLDNLALYQDGTKVADGTVSGNYITFVFTPIAFEKGATKQYQVKGDIISGSARVIELGIYRSTDLLVKGETYGYNITPTYSGTGSSSSNPVLQDNEFTVSQGTFRVGRSSTVGSENIAVGDNQTLGAFELEAKGEPIIVSALTLTIVSSTVGATILEDALQSVKLVDASGATVAGPTDVTNNALTVAFTDSFTVPVGVNHYKVVGNIATNGGWISNNTIYAKISTPATAITAKGENTGLSITPTPAADITTATQTVKAANVTVSKNSTPTNKSVITNSTGVLIGSWSFDASNSGEDIRITSIAIKASSTGKLNNLTLKDGSTALDPTNDAVTATTIAAPTTSTFALSEPIIITKGTSKTINLYADIGSDALQGEVDAWGITSGAAVTAYGVTTGNSANVSVTASDGALVTIATAGTIEFLEHADSLTQRLVVDGSTAQALTDMKVKATNEDVDITSLTIYVQDGGLTGTGAGSYTQLSKVYLKLDGTIVGNVDGYNMADASKLINLERGQLTIPKGDAGKKLSILGDIVEIGTGEPGTEAVDIKVGISDPATTVGAGSNASAARTYTDASGSAVIIHEAVPQVAIVPVATFGGSLASGHLHRTNITAVGGPIGIWRMSYEVTTNTATLDANTAYLYCASGCSGIPNGTQLSATSDGADVEAQSRENFFLEVDSSFANSKSYVQIAENATAVIDLYATISGQSTTQVDSAVVRLLGDQATTTADNLTGNAATTSVWGETDQVHNNFIWSSLYSDSSNSAAALAAEQWFNGYLVSGMGTAVSTTPISIPES